MFFSSIQHALQEIDGYENSPSNNQNKEEVSLYYNLSCMALLLLGSKDEEGLLKSFKG
jgi:hypothetical protein